MTSETMIDFIGIPSSGRLAYCFTKYLKVKSAFEART
jgi:hypothetical protein